MRSKFGLVRVLAAMVVLALAVGVPTAAAGPKLDKKQNKTIKKQGKQIKKGNKAVRNIRKAAKATDDAIAALKIVAERGDKNATGILALAPSIVNGLTALQAGLVQAGAGLTSLQTLATSTEYGVGQVFIGGTAAGGSFVVTPDIPDAVQQAQTTQTFVAGAPGVITVQVGVRSAESDGTASTGSAAHCRVTVASGSNTTTSSPNPDPPAPTAPFWSIDLKSPQTNATETSFPFGPISTDVLTDLTAVGNSTNPTATPATAVAGAPYTVTLSCVDLSASATDPSA